MAIITEPTQWATTLCNSGDANVIPQSTALGTGEASFDEGFPQITQVPLGAGGIAPNRKDFNGLFKLLADWLFYIQNGGVPSYNSAYDYTEGRIVLHTDNRIYFCIQANGALNPKDPSNTAYWSLIPIITDFDEIGFKTGDIKIQTTATIPSGWLLCNGAGVSRTTFSNLFAKIGSTYGDGDGSTTFNIPDLRDRYIIGANTNLLGAYIAEQLPNVTGSYVPLHNTGNSADAWDRIGAGYGHTGVFYGATQATFSYWTGTMSTGTENVELRFNANGSNNIYTDSGKVYPASIALNFIIKT